MFDHKISRLRVGANVPTNHCFPIHRQLIRPTKAPSQKRAPMIVRKSRPPNCLFPREVPHGAEGLGHLLHLALGDGIHVIREIPSEIGVPAMGRQLPESRFLIDMLCVIAPSSGP